MRAGINEGEKQWTRTPASGSAKYPPSRKAGRAGDQRAAGAIQPRGMALRKGTGAAMDGVSLHTQLNTGNPRAMGIASLINISKWPKDGFQYFQPSSSGCVWALALALALGLASSFRSLVLPINFGSEAES